MVLSMLLFGGPTLHYFALALTIGILFGIYSSVFVAAAIAMWLGVKREDLISRQRKRTPPAARWSDLLLMQQARAATARASRAARPG